METPRPNSNSPDGSSEGIGELGFVPAFLAGQWVDGAAPFDKTGGLAGRASSHSSKGSPGTPSAGVPFGKLVAVPRGLRALMVVRDPIGMPNGGQLIDLVIV